MQNGDEMLGHADSWKFVAKMDEVLVLALDLFHMIEDVVVVVAAMVDWFGE